MYTINQLKDMREYDIVSAFDSSKSLKLLQAIHGSPINQSLETLGITKFTWTDQVNCDELANLLAEASNLIHFDIRFDTIRVEISDNLVKVK